MRVIVITNPAPKNINDVITINNDDYIILVDAALEQIDHKKIKVDLVIGDFDSLKNKRILNKFNYLKLDEEKDMTDTYAAIKQAYTLSNDVILVGGIKGDRIEHFIANLYLLNEFNNLIIIDENTKISLLGVGNHVIFKNDYTSFFAKENAIVSLKGFKYPLSDYKLNKYDPLTISNQVIKSYGELIIKGGSVFVFETKEKR